MENTKNPVPEMIREYQIGNTLLCGKIPFKRTGTGRRSNESKKAYP